MWTEQGHSHPRGHPCHEAFFHMRLRKRAEAHAFCAAPESERLHMAVRAGAAGKGAVLPRDRTVAGLGLLPWALREGNSAQGSCRWGWYSHDTAGCVSAPGLR